MSHKAINWAMEQRGLRPATWRVLVQLADRHNRDTGRCDPSQDRLAEDCEISRSTLNVHLEILEARGLIRRVQRLDPRTRRQATTSYILGFDLAQTQEPCPEAGPGDDAGTGARPCAETGHGPCPEIARGPCPENAESRVRKSDTNPGREPGSKNPPKPPRHFSADGGARGRRARAAASAMAGVWEFVREMEAADGPAHIH